MTCKPVFPTHRSLHPKFCVCCGREENCLGKKRRKFHRLTEAVKREEKKRAKGAPNAGLLAALSADANILLREIDRITHMERERDEVQS